MKRALAWAFRALGSFHLSVALFGLLTLITWAGTISQETIGLFQSQKLYFESWAVFRRIGPVHVPVLPGGMLLCTALFVNLVVGGILRFVPRLRTRARGRDRGLRLASGLGIALTHLGIAGLLLACFAKYVLAEEGGIQLFEGESTSEFVSYHDWELAIAEMQDDGVTREHLVPHAAFADRSAGRTVSLGAPDLPFRLAVSDFAPNTDVRRVPPGAPVPSIDGYALLPVAPRNEWELNVAGCVARAEDRSGAPLGSAILWGLARHPWTVVAAGRTFTISLRKRRAPLPFRLQLDRFTHEYHPNTTIPRVFLSDVTVLGDAGVDRHRIRMNQPLRRDGVVIYQSSFGPQGASPGTPLFSGLSVVRNPADPWPWRALYVIAAGMTLHFVARLGRFVRDQAAELRQRSAA